MGNAAVIFNRTFSPNKEFQSVVPFPPAKPPPTENNNRSYSRKRKTPITPAPVTEDYKESIQEKSSDRSQKTAPTELVDRSITSRSNDRSLNSADFKYTEGQLRREGMNACELECSQITKFLFVGGQRVAENLELLKEKGITRIINCSLSITKNYHEGVPNMTYLSKCDF
jgi:hypothetical protein